jgi:hypothetical protein
VVGGAVRDRGEPARLLPVRIKPCTLPPLLAGRIHIDLVDVGEPEAIQRLRQGAAASLRGERGKPMTVPAFPGYQRGLPDSQPPWPGAGPGIANLPARNPHFTGRADLLTVLEGQLDAGSAAALVAAHGLGGVGKTQLALEYAHQHAGAFELVWWVPAETPLAAATVLAELAPRLGLPVEPDLEATAAAVVHALGRRSGWLLVLDNAEDPELVNRLRPGGDGGRVLVTFRNPAFGQLGAKVQVEVWPPDVAAGFLLERTGTGDTDRPADEQAALELAAELGGLPLALAQAAAYCEQTSLDLTGYPRGMSARACALGVLTPALAPAACRLMPVAPATAPSSTTGRISSAPTMPMMGQARPPAGNDRQAGTHPPTHRNRPAGCRRAAGVAAAA